MWKKHIRWSRKHGQVPGTVEHIGLPRDHEVRIRLIRYDKDHFHDEILTPEPSVPGPEPGAGVTWLLVNGVHDVDLLKRIGRERDIHPLIMEDLANTAQQPKAEEYEDTFFMVIRVPLREAEEGGEFVQTEQVSMIVQPGLLIAFTETSTPHFEPVLRRLQVDGSRLRSRGVDYLFYALLDLFVDNCFPVLEKLGDELESLEDQIMDAPGKEERQKLHDLKRRVLFWHKQLRPLRHLLSRLTRLPLETLPLMDDTKPFLRDVHDHVTYLLETLDSFRETADSLQELYLNSLSHNMNQVMKTLTLTAAVFIPLTFIAGIYGMNFNPDASSLNMPELNWSYGYVTILGVMAVVALAMIWVFHRRKWL